tara:strand:- start:679 stop:954 length:276 start_codon:yes stop_codon:yes gene_type:complete
VDECFYKNNLIKQINAGHIDGHRTLVSILFDVLTEEQVRKYVLEEYDDNELIEYEFIYESVIDEDWCGGVNLWTEVGLLDGGTQEIFEREK